MAEFQEVMRQWRRMCADGSIGYACAECKMYSSIDESICRGIPSEDDAKNIERFVMSWAAEHPEPVYPTWTEWLSKQGFIELKEGQFLKRTENEYIYECKTVAVLTDKAAVPIHEDIAQKLGIEPKEG